MPPPRHALASAAAVLALSACGGEGGNDARPVQPEVRIRPGLWEVTSEILSASEQELPVELADRARGRRRVARQCISPEQAARPDGNFLMLGRSGGCVHEGFDMSGGRITDNLTCRAPDGAVTRARVSGRYEAEAYAMRMEIDTPGIGEGHVMRLVTRQTGRRVGDCPAAAAEGGNRQ